MNRTVFCGWEQGILHPSSVVELSPWYLGNRVLLFDYHTSQKLWFLVVVKTLSDQTKERRLY